MTAKYVDWTADKSDRKKGNGKSRFLKLNGKHRLRIIGKAIRYMQHWTPVICRSPGRDKDGNILDPLMQQGLEPKPRFSVWVIDRDDNGEMKIIDYPETLQDKFCAWTEEFKNEVGGKSGPDWRITVTGKGLNTRYEVMPLDRTPLTEEEIAKAKELDIHKQLSDLRRDHTPEEILQMLADNKAGGGGTQGAQAEAQPQAQAQPAAPAVKAEAKAAVAAPAAGDDLNF